MQSSKGEMLAAYLFLFLDLLQGVISLRITTQPELYVTPGPNVSIVLNCTYIIENNEDISYMFIYWKKNIGDKYAKLAEFYPDNYAKIHEEGDYLRNRSYVTNPGNGSTSAILTINDVRCDDDGYYQCYVWYNSKTATSDEHELDTAVILQVRAERPTKFTLYPNNSLEENDTVNLSCYANVGNPDGKVAIWKVDTASNIPILLNETNSGGNKMENCTTILSVTVAYNVSRNDNGVLFRCSSQNNQTHGLAPSRHTAAIEVFYGPSNVTITTSPSNPNFVTGSNVNLKCSSDGNPDPTFKWKFNSTLISNNSMLLLRNINLNHSGIYVCMASNKFKGKSRNGSSNFTLIVLEKEEPVTIYQPTCDANPCGVTESCSETDGKAVCATNIWSVISFVFIAVCLIFMVTTVILCIKRRNLNESSKNVDVPLSLMGGDDFGGYADPMDVKKLYINGQADNNVNDTAKHGDPVDQNSQYASVQKSPPDASNPPNVYDGAWN